MKSWLETQLNNINTKAISRPGTPCQQRSDPNIYAISLSLLHFPPFHLSPVTPTLHRQSLPPSNQPPFMQQQQRGKMLPKWPTAPPPRGDLLLCSIGQHSPIQGEEGGGSCIAYYSFGRRVYSDVFLYKQLRLRIGWVIIYVLRVQEHETVFSLFDLNWLRKGHLYTFRNVLDFRTKSRSQSPPNHLL